MTSTTIRTATRRLRVAVRSVSWSCSARCCGKTTKAVGNEDGTILFGVRLLPRTDDAAIPHVLDVLARFAEPEPATGQRVGLVWRC